MSSSPSRPRLTFIDALRAFGALSVFLVHAVGIMAVTVEANPGGVADLFVAASAYGYLGVDLFFVISGFVIAYSIRDDHVTLGYAGRFAARRSLRLDPPYWCAIVVGILWIVLRKRLGTGIEPTPTVSQVLSHLVYLQSILGQGQIEVVFWTLCLEVQLYLAFIVLLLLSAWLPRWARFDLGNAGATMTLCALVVSFAWPAGLIGDSTASGVATEFPVWFPPTAFKFLMGASVAYVYIGRLRLAHVTGVLLLLAMIMIADLATETHALAKNGMALSVLVTVLTAASLLVGIRVGGLSTWLRWRPLMFVGAVSYSFYLLHVPIVGLVIALQKRSGLTGLGSSLGLFVLALALTLLAAAALFHFVERPSMGLARRVVKKAPLKAEMVSSNLSAPNQP